MTLSKRTAALQAPPCESTGTWMHDSQPAGSTAAASAPATYSSVGQGY